MDRLADNDCDDITIVVVARDDGLREGLRVPNISHFALRHITITNPVDDHVIAF